MNSRYAKIIIIVFLSVFAVMLYYFYETAEDKNKITDNTTEQNNSVKSKDKILSDLDSILNSFGIRKDWIRENPVKDKVQKNPGTELIFSKEVRIPTDLPSIDLNYEITNYFRKNNNDVKVSEDPRSKNITMNIFTAKDTVVKQTGIIKFFYADTLKRNAAEVALVLDSIDLFSLKHTEEILISTQEFSVILPMRNDKADYQARIIELNRDYLLKLSVGDEDDIEADFKDGMKESVRSSKIKSLSLSFPNTAGVILISRTGNRELYNAVKNDFIKNNIKVYSDSVFDDFRSGENKVISLFEDIINEAKSGKKFLFYDVKFDPEEFTSYDKMLYSMKKLGYRFTSFKSLISKINQ
ncbi:MAG TPA: hypothetical protein PKC91_09250 [Ignavibacteria bacterium]|nr:hypothetical protein [Ignavibacteria bacterium]